MASIVWQPVRDAMTTAIAAARARTLVSRLAVGQPILGALNGAGPSYDAHYTDAVDAAKVASLSANRAALLAWLTPRFASIDAAAAWAEGQQRDANALHSASPYSQTIAGAQVLLTPGAAIPVTADVAEPTVALKTIGTVTLIALRPGLLGNKITVQIADPADSGTYDPATYFRAVVSLGDYVEVADPRAAGSLFVAASRLLQPPAWSTSPARPTNGIYLIGGGTGDAVSELLQRITRARSLPVIQSDTAAKQLIDSYWQQALELQSGRPKERFSEPYASLRPLELQLAQAVAQATDFLAIEP